MRILVLSDNHNKEIELDFNLYDLVIHAGDRGIFKNENIKYVRGNCDLTGEKEIYFSYNDKFIYVTHGDLYNVKYTYDRLVYRAMELNARLCIFGHTHNQCFFEENNIMFLNPGAYKDGFYAVVTDDFVELYNNEFCYKRVRIKWWFKCY